MKPHARWAVSLCLCLAACGPKEGPGAAPAGGTGTAPPAPAAPEGRWVKAERKVLVRSTSVTGSLAAPRSTQVSPRVAGRITDILVDVGARVHATQELVRFDSSLSAIEVDQRKADLKIEQTGLADAELNLNRMDKLWNKPEGQAPSIPKKVYDDAKSKRDAAAAKVAQAEQALKRAEAMLQETVLRAPFDGVVTLRKSDPGAWVPIGEGVLEIQETATLELEFSLPQGLLASVGAGTTVEFDIEGLTGGPWPAEISTVVPAMNVSTRSFTCKAIVDNAKERLMPGLLARVKVTLKGGEATIVVPAAAVSSGPEGKKVVARRDAGAGEARVVKTGEPWADEIPVLEGLSEGDEVFLPGKPPEEPR